MKTLVEDFKRDIDFLVGRISNDLNEKGIKEIFRLRNRLIDLKKRRVVNTAHSVMELIVARHLIKRGYRIEVEHSLNSISCDVYGLKGLGNIIVEIETGYVPPHHALEPQRYLRARISSKIARYSNYCSRFVIGIPPYYLMPLEKIFLIPPRERTLSDLKKIKELCDIYYTSPPVSTEEIKNARIHSIYIIDVDKLYIEEMDPETYYLTKLKKSD